MGIVSPLRGAPPAWWRALPRQQALSARFVQESDSAVFGKLSQRGALVLAQGGRLRVSYDSGLLVVSDGRTLTQYDPDTRTAQRIALGEALRAFPLLGLLLEPSRIGVIYRVEALPDGTVLLHPREAGLPEVRVAGRNGLLHTLAWTDGTGAHQRMELEDARTPAHPPAGAFRFDPPKGTRWVSPEGSRAIPPG